ncbi:MAG: DNA topoisomerase VI subunit B, partial [Methanosarcinaceae archaeon]|nr:DNA topoisomerase VI subunit B [Methanosarcinaceae archaeon]
EILPHPEGIELGTLMKMLHYTERQRLTPFLRYSFCKIGLYTADEICKAAGLNPEIDPHTLSRHEAQKLIEAFHKVKIMAPPTDCLSPIGEELIYRGLEKEVKVDFIATSTRKPAVYSGSPFVVEVGLAYGGKLPGDEKINLMRFANRVPLLYQQGACVTTHAVENIKWKQYGLNQPGGGIPNGPGLLLIHLASTNVPFTSESKDAIADIPVLKAEVELAVKEVARKLKHYLSKQKTLKKRKEKEIIINRVLPKMAVKVADILEKEVPDIDPIVAKIMGNVLVSREVQLKEDGSAEVGVKVKNFGATSRSFKVHEMHPYRIVKAKPEPKCVTMGETYDYIWEIKAAAGSSKLFSYQLEAVSSEEIARFQLIVEGLEEELVTGAKAIKRV